MTIESGSSEASWIAPFDEFCNDSRHIINQMNATGVPVLVTKMGSFSVLVEPVNETMAERLPEGLEPPLETN